MLLCEQEVLDAPFSSNRVQLGALEPRRGGLSCGGEEAAIGLPIRLRKRRRGRFGTSGYVIQNRFFAHGLGSYKAKFLSSLARYFSYFHGLRLARLCTP